MANTINTMIVLYLLDLSFDPWTSRVGANA